MWLSSIPISLGSAGKGVIVPPMPTLAWFDASTGVTTAKGVSAWADQSGGVNTLSQATAANQPVYLPYTGTKYIYSGGVNGNYVSTPSAPANAITGDIDVRWYGSLDNLTSLQELVDKTGAPGNYAYSMYVLSGALYAFVSPDGTALLQASAVLTGVTANTLVWLRFTRVATTGVFTFYKSTDGVTWTTLGTTTLATGNIFAGTALVAVCNRASGGIYPVFGKTYRAQIYNGVNGTLVVDCNPASYTSGSTWTSTTGETWTVTATGALPTQIVNKASVMFNGTAHFLKTAAFTANQPITLYLVAKQITYTSGNYLLDGLTVNTGAITQSGTSPAIVLNAGTAAASNTNMTLGSTRVLAAVFNGATSSLLVSTTTATSGNAGAGNMGGLTLGASGGNLNFGNLQVNELKIYAGAHNAITQATNIAALAAKWGAV